MRWDVGGFNQTCAKWLCAPPAAQPFLPFVAQSTAAAAAVDIYAHASILVVILYTLRWTQYIGLGENCLAAGRGASCGHRHDCATHEETFSTCAFLNRRCRPGPVHDRILAGITRTPQVTTNRLQNRFMKVRVL